MSRQTTARLFNCHKFSLSSRFRRVVIAGCLISLCVVPGARAAAVNTYGALDGDDGSPTPQGKVMFDMRHITGLATGQATPQILMGISFGTFKRTEFALTWNVNVSGSNLPTFPAVWPWFKYAVWYEEDKARPLDLSLLIGAAIPAAGSTVPGSLGFMAVAGKHWEPFFLVLNLGYAVNAPVTALSMPSEHLFYGNISWTYDFSDPWGVYGELFGHLLTVSPPNGGANIGLMWRPKAGLSFDLTAGPTFASGTTTFNLGTGFTVTI